MSGWSTGTTHTAAETVPLHKRRKSCSYSAVEASFGRAVVRMPRRVYCSASPRTPFRLCTAVTASSELMDSSIELVPGNFGGNAKLCGSSGDLDSTKMDNERCVNKNVHETSVAKETANKAHPE